MATDILLTHDRSLATVLMANDQAAGDGPMHSNISTPKALTHANLKTHQQETTQARASETRVHEWLAGSCNCSSAGHTAESWARLVVEDKLAADIEAAVRLGDRK